jgi:acyl-coenzyme A thioesterase PaaI-like protein
LSESLVPPGWKIRPGMNFNTFVGPFYEVDGGDSMRSGFVTDDRHGNKRGVTHGGMIATSFDVALGNAAWSAADGQRCATIQLTIQYVGALQLHEFAEVTVEVVRATRSLVFLRGVMVANGRMIATADGVWKILKWRDDATPVAEQS